MSPITERCSGVNGICRGRIPFEPQSPTMYWTVLKSTDGGASWTEGGPGAFFNNLVLDPGALNTLYAAGRGIYKSTDGGANWSAVNSGLPDGYRTLALTIDPRIPGTIYALLGLAKASLEMPQGECCEYLQGEKLR